LDEIEFNAGLKTRLTMGITPCMKEQIIIRLVKLLAASEKIPKP